jgi:hypothetical protein
MITLNKFVDCKLWSARDVMRLLGYSSTSAFWVFVHASGVPYVSLNSRRAVFHPPALEAWLRRRAVGTHAAPIVSLPVGEPAGRDGDSNSKGSR